MSGMSDRPPPQPEGRVIAAAQKNAGLSAREAARRAGMSEGRWRQVVSGYQIVTKGVYVEVVGPADTVARMASVVGATPEDFEPFRPDVASELRQLQEAARPSLTLVSDAENPTAAETAMLQLLTAMQKELDELRELKRGVQVLEEKVDRLESRQSKGDGSDKRPA